MTMSALLDRKFTMAANTVEPRRFLFTHWEGGGNTPPIVSIVRRLVARGHDVRVLSDPCNREDFQAAGASFAPWTRAPHRLDKSPASDPMRDWEARSPVEMMKRLSDYLFVGSALARAQDTLDEVNRFHPDVIATSEMLLGVMAAAESAKIPCVALSSNIYVFPLPDLPAFGPGFLPARGPLGRLRDRFVRSMARRTFGKGTVLFNQARAALGLSPVSHPFDQLESLSRHLVLTSAAFDFPTKFLPSTVVYTGPELDDPDWVEPWQSPWKADDTRPLVLVGFSSTFQDQGQSLQRVINALGSLPVRTVVTTGPAIDIASLNAGPNVHLCRSAPHNQLLRQASLVITHAGHGTVIRALAAGVPMLCMPMGRDQNDNAARVFARGVGLRLSPKAATEKIRTVVEQLLHDPTYMQRAHELGQQITRDAMESPAVEILENVAGSRVSRNAQK
jgi:MGT family glycosyltransferase